MKEDEGKIEEITSVGFVHDYPNDNLNKKLIRVGPAKGTTGIAFEFVTDKQAIVYKGDLVHSHGIGATLLSVRKGDEILYENKAVSTAFQLNAKEAKQLNDIQNHVRQWYLDMIMRSPTLDDGEDVSIKITAGYAGYSEKDKKLYSYTINKTSTDIYP